jgi:exosome complex RNA-binding protein Rrp4
VTGGEIIVGQRGTKFHPGNGVGIGKDDTIFAKSAGTVQFKKRQRGRVISVDPAAAEYLPFVSAGHTDPRGQEVTRARLDLRS